MLRHPDSQATSESVDSLRLQTTKGWCVRGISIIPIIEVNTKKMAAFDWKKDALIQPSTRMGYCGYNMV